MKKNRRVSKSQSESPSRRELLQRSVIVAGGAALSSLASTRLVAAAGQNTARAAGDAVVVSASSKKNIVETDTGKVFGFSRDGIFTFKGIPYGASTDGKNRFMPPGKPTPWTGVRSALYWGPVSPQVYTSTFDGRRGGWKHDDESFMFEWEDGQPSDDCLRINVWTPSISDNKKRPVMVWIHGGGFSTGSDNELRMYDGENLARHGDVVVVSLNHRLGVLGYLNLMDYGEQYASSPNVGMLDIVAALDWVKTNVSNFGGDPNMVLIFGQSGGGGKVSTLMGMPSAKGLFHRAVIESSGGPIRQGTREHSAAVTAAVIEELGLSKSSVDKIQDFSSQMIVEAGLRAAKKLARVGAVGGLGGDWSPVVDGIVLPRNVWEPDAPSYSANVPLLIGSVLNEMGNSIQMGDASLEGMSIDEVKSRLNAQYKDRAAKILASFQEKYPSETPFDLFARISGMPRRLDVVTVASRKAVQGAAPAYAYLFQWQTPVLDGRPRAYHCSELPFVFHNTDRCATMTGGGPGPLALCAKIADAWVSFARKGDPNHAGLAQWPAFTSEKVPTMIFDNECVMRENPDGPQRAAFS